MFAPFKARATQTTINQARLTEKKAKTKNRAQTAVDPYSCVNIEKKHKGLKGLGNIHEQVKAMSRTPPQKMFESNSLKFCLFGLELKTHLLLPSSFTLFHQRNPTSSLQHARVHNAKLELV
jgi:hypothetical protein